MGELGRGEGGAGEEEEGKGEEEGGVKVGVAERPDGGDEEGREPWECGRISATRIVASSVSSAWLPTTLLFAVREGGVGAGED